MAVADTVSNWASAASNATMDIQPGAAAEWLIHTLMAGSGKAFEVYMTEDGVTFTLMDQLSGGSVHGLTHRLTNSKWLRLKNTSGGTAYIGYSGVVTK